MTESTRQDSATRTLSDSDFAVGIDDRYFEDYVAGAVYEYGYVRAGGNGRCPAAGAGDLAGVPGRLEFRRRRSRPRGPRVSMAASIGYVAFLAGPPVVGFLGDRSSNDQKVLVNPADFGAGQAGQEGRDGRAQLFGGGEGEGGVVASLGLGL